MKAELENQKLIILGKEVSERTPSGDLIIIDVLDAETSAQDYKDDQFIRANRPPNKSKWLKRIVVKPEGKVDKPELPPDRGL